MTPDKGFIVMQQVGNGSEEFGCEWVEPKWFGPETTLAEVWEWVRGLQVDLKGCTMLRPNGE